MNKSLTVAALLLYCNVLWSQQPQDVQNSYQITGAAKLGSAVLNTLDLENFSGDVYVSEVLVGYNIKNKLKISTGLALLRFNSNYFENDQQFGFESDFIQVPLKFNFGYGLLKAPNFENLDFVLGFGFLGNYHLSETIANSDTSFENDFQGWHFGLMAEFGLELKLNSNIGFGLFFENNFANSSFADNDKIRLRNNLIKLSFGYNF